MKKFILIFAITIFGTYIHSSHQASNLTPARRNAWLKESIELTIDAQRQTEYAIELNSVIAHSNAELMNMSTCNFCCYFCCMKIVSTEVSRKLTIAESELMQAKLKMEILKEFDEMQR